ncbi:MAG: 23S rRNA (pseudouridine(1915)-N(3))-methyltransferase RlmH [Oscillospiraceae bacterium]
MLAVQIICVGKLKERFFAEAAAEYEKRLTPLYKFSITELPEQRLPQTPSDAEISAALEREAYAILPLLPKSAAVVALCIEGKPMSSEALAEKLDSWPTAGKSQVIFLIGGSCGLHNSVKERADLRLSMSPMTFPHHLARVMLLEQIYRAAQINLGTKYHK